MRSERIQDRSTNDPEPNRGQTSAPIHILDIDVLLGQKPYFTEDHFWGGGGRTRSRRISGLAMIQKTTTRVKVAC
jgi:hypothetical protein